MRRLVRNCLRRQIFFPSKATMAVEFLCIVGYCLRLYHSTKFMPPKRQWKDRKIIIVFMCIVVSEYILINASWICLRFSEVFRGYVKSPVPWYGIIYKSSNSSKRWKYYIMYFWYIWEGQNYSCSEYRTLSNKHRGAYLILRLLGAALISKEREMSCIKFWNLDIVFFKMKMRYKTSLYKTKPRAKIKLKNNLNNFIVPLFVYLFHMLFGLVDGKMLRRYIKGLTSVWISKAAALIWSPALIKGNAVFRISFGGVVFLKP